MGYPHGSLSERFWRKVKVGSASECWLWQAAKQNKGYGVMCDGTAHRIAWKLAYGSIPDGKCVLHRCDTPACVNVRHLFLGSIGDNNRDMFLKGRGHIRIHRGEKNPSAKLTWEQVNEIRTLRKSGWILKRLASKFNVSISAISFIVSGEHWKVKPVVTVRG